MKNTIFRKDVEGWAYGVTECGDLFVGYEGDWSEQTTYMKDTPENRVTAENYWKSMSFAAEVKENKVGDFTISNVKGGWAIYNSNGQELRRCKTKKECYNRIANQTV